MRRAAVRALPIGSRTATVRFGSAIGLGRIEREALRNAIHRGRTLHCPLHEVRFSRFANRDLVTNRGFARHRRGANRVGVCPIFVCGADEVARLDGVCIPTNAPLAGSSVARRRHRGLGPPKQLRFIRRFLGTFGRGGALTPNGFARVREQEPIAPRPSGRRSLRSIVERRDHGAQRRSQAKRSCGKLRVRSGARNP